eukprot:gene27089-35804_t
MEKNSIKRFFVSSRNEDKNVDDKRRRIEPLEIKSGLSDLKTSSEKNSIISDDAVVSSSKTPEESTTLVGWPPMDSLEPSWRQRLLPEYTKPYFQRLMAFVGQEIDSGKTIYPPSEDVFTALNLCPFDKTRVVIIGQDPYHGPGQAHGLAFSVRKGVQIPPSLRNMITEHWATQGVLLLNTVLTVRKADANSHQKKGWEEFTDSVVRELGKRKGLVYLLWGKPAQLKCKGIDSKSNVVITSSHPSPLSAYKTDEAFIGSRCFSRCNAALVAAGQQPIDWNIL